MMRGYGVKAIFISVPMNGGIIGRTAPALLQQGKRGESVFEKVTEYW